MARRKTKPDNYSGRGRYATRDSYPAPRTALAALELPETGTVELVTRHGATSDLTDGRPFGVHTETVETMHILPGGSLGGFIH